VKIINANSYKNARLKRFYWLSGLALFLLSVAGGAYFLNPKHGEALGQVAYDVLGQSDFSHVRSDAVVTSQAGFDGPREMAMDAIHHRLFIVDSGNNRVLVYALNNANAPSGTTATNVIGQPNFTGSKPATISATSLNHPGGISYDATHDRLYVADASNDRVLVYDLSGGITNGMAASYVFGQTDMTSSDNNGFQPTASNFISPQWVDYDASQDRVFISDNNRVLVYDLSGGISNGMSATHVIGAPDFTTGYNYGACGVSGGSLQAAVLCGAGSITYDTASKQLLVSDDGNGRILIFDLTSGVTDGMSPVHVLGASDFTTWQTHRNDHNVYYNALQTSYDSANQRFFVTDESGERVLIFDFSSGITDNMNASYVIGQPDFATLNQGPTQIEIATPWGSVYDPGSQLLYIADSGDNRVLGFDLSSGITSGMGANYVLGQPDFTSKNVNNIHQPNVNGLDNPSNLALDSIHHRLFVTDSANNRVLIYTLDSTNKIVSHQPSNVLGQPDFLSYDYVSAAQNTMRDPTGIAVDASSNRLFVSDERNQRVLIYDLSSGITNGMNASYVLGQANFTDSVSGTTQSNMDTTMGLSYDATHKRLFVADLYNYRVLVYDLSGSITNGMDASYVLGQPNFTSSNPGSGQNGMDRVYDASYDAVHDRLFVTDLGNSRILVFDLSGGITNGMNASYVLGQKDFTVTSWGESRTKLDFPTAAYIDATGTTLVVADGSNARIAVFDLSSGITNGMPMSDMYGAGDFVNYQDGCANDAIPSASNLCYPEDAIFDSAARTVYAADTDNNRIFAYDASYTIVDSLPDGYKHVPYSSKLGVLYGSGSNVYSISSGSLPPGLSLSTDGTISGTPTMAGDFSVTFSATDSNNDHATRPITFHIGTSAGYAASDVVGQVDLLDNPVFNDGATYNDTLFNRTGSPNAQGLEWPDGSVVDTVHHRLFVTTCGARTVIYNLDASNNLLDHTADYVLGQPDLNSDDYWPSGGNAAIESCPNGASYDPAHDRLFVPDGNDARVLVYDLSGGITNGMDASYVLGQPDFSGMSSNPPLQNTLGQSYGGSAYDPTTSLLYVSDTNNVRIMVYDLSGGITNGMDASYVLGQPDFTSNGGGITQAGGGGPFGLALDSERHRLFVADANNGRVLMYDTSHLSNGMNADFVLGPSDFTTSGIPSGGTVTAHTMTPEGLAYDPSHQRLFVADYAANRALVFDVSNIHNGIDPIGVIGQTSLTSKSVCDSNVSEVTSGQRNLCSPEGTADYYDISNNRLYISDSDYNRVMMYDFVTLTTTSVQNGATDVAYHQPLAQQHAQGDVQYALSDGVLPVGLSVDPNGSITGSPRQAGSFHFTITVSDNNGAVGIFTDTKQYAMTVTQSPTTTGATLGSAHGIIETGSHQPGTNDNTTVDLDGIPAFTASTGPGTGYQAGVTAGSELTLTTGTDTTTVYHMVVGKVTESSVVINVGTLGGGDISLTLGVQKTVDLDGDGIPDIGIKLVSSDGTTAQLLLWKIPLHVPSTPHSSQHPGSPASNGSSSSGQGWIIWTAGAATILLVIGGVVYILRRNRLRN